MSLAAQFHEFGPASVLIVGEVPEPTAGPNQIRIRVKAAGLNPVDSKLRAGLFHPKAPAGLPSGIGHDLAGIVDQVGSGVTAFQVGDEVFGCVDGDAIAEYVVSEPGNFAIKPAGVTWEVAGGLAITGQTAFDSVHSQQVTAADTVLVSAAAGGVGVIVSQLAARTGATVLGTASANNHEFLKTLGVIPLTYGPDLAEHVRAIAPKRPTVVFDNHGVDTVTTAIELGVDTDRINSITHVDGYGIRLVGRGQTSPTILEELAQLIARGELVVPIHATFPLAGVAEAFAVLDNGHVRGKVVILL